MRGRNEFTIVIGMDDGVTVTGSESENEFEKRTFFVAVHVGAGYHSPSNHKPLRSAMNRACLAAASVLRHGSGLSLDAVVAAIQLLEVSIFHFTNTIIIITTTTISFIVKH